MRHILQIDNLRALAVLAVLINHLEDRWLPSGFLGVDIFFVISGFVVTKSLVNRDSNGFLVEFYLGRIKRLFPALLFCTLVSTLMALCFLTTTYSEISIRTASKALIAMSNFFLIDKALDYFSLSTSLNLFTHTWSLSVEEQFYLFYPIVFILIRKFSKRENSFPVLIIFLTLFSFVAYLNIENPIFSYYSLSSRFWQISMGALTYYFISNKNLKFHNNLVLLFLGLLIASLSLPVHHQFISRIFVSSFTAILIVLICFINETKTYLLENKFLNLIGRSSYSLYLWHWPIIALARNTLGVSLLTLPVILLLILIFTAFSYLIIENRFRYLKFEIPKQHQLILGLAIIAVSTFLVKKSAKLDLYLGNPTTSFSMLGKDNWNYRYCNTYRSRELKKWEKKDFEKCKFKGGKPVSDQHVFLYGDSYAQQIAPTVFSTFSKQTGSIYAFAASGCHPLKMVHPVENGEKRCETYFNEFKSFVLSKLKPKDFFILSFSNNFINDSDVYAFQNKLVSKEIVRTKFFTDLAELSMEVKSKGASFYWVSNIPVLRLEPNLCYQKWSHLRSDCSLERLDVVKTNQRKETDALIRKHVENMGIRFVDIMTPLEKNIMFNNLYFNTDHLAFDGAEWLSSYFLHEVSEKKE